MADHSAEHKHGSMDIRAQEKTFAGFIRMSIWVGAISIGILIFMGLVNS
jgi:Ni,Fe-hydrogenase I cytochrome b subunit